MLVENNVAHVNFQFENSVSSCELYCISPVARRGGLLIRDLNDIKSNPKHTRSL